MNKQNQNGSAFVVVIIILVVAIIGALGFVVWQNYLQPKANPGSSQADTNKSNGTSPESQQTNKYITLTDWNVKLKVPNNLEASTIKYNKNRIAEAPEYYSLTTTKIYDQGGKCATGYPFGDIVSLERTTDKQTAIENAASYGGELINNSAINNYFYYYQTSIASTTPVPSCAVTSLANSERALLIELVKSLVAA
jgi:cytoskeletal protein RodZ